jgi:hypothetical protein
MIMGLPSISLVNIGLSVGGKCIGSCVGVVCVSQFVADSFCTMVPYHR